MTLLGKLKDRWGIQSTLQVLIILVVFSCTGLSLLFVKDPFYRLVGVDEQTPWWLRTLVFTMALLPLYNLLLLGWGFVFGQFRFFWNFEKRLFGRLRRLVRR